mgnify:FL=1
MTYVVAEIGVNWNGSLDLAKEMMEKSKNAGCDAVKFQAFDETIVGQHLEKDRLLKTSINEHNIEDIHQIAKSIGIEWFCTPMILKAVDLLNPYVKKIKIRESDSHLLLQNKTNELIEAIMKTEKEIIVSSQQNPKKSKYYNEKKINWLYCVPEYPCPLTNIDFSELESYSGYSNHCPEIIAPITAAALGTKIIEVHITSNKEKNFFDNPVSFNYRELEEIMKQVRNIEKIKR